MTEIVVAAAELIPPEAQGNPFASVAVHCDSNGCAAARDIAGQRHLLEEAPALPLPQCVADTCNCRYFRYGDRRSLLTNRRSQGVASGHANNWHSTSNRRSGQDRRKLKIDFRRWI